MPHDKNDILSRARVLLDGISPGEWAYFEGFSVKHVEASNYGTVILSYDNNTEDLQFIAAAPALVRELCAEVEALQEDLESTEKSLKEYSGFFEELCAGLKKRFPVEYSMLEGDEYGNDAFTVNDLFAHVVDAVLFKERTK